ncbi:MAG: hypothetical protein AAGL98_15480, partial [Planctomycetota bacterium]
VDQFEIDTLSGGAGADDFYLGVLDSNLDPHSFYLSRVDPADDETDSRAIITDFDAVEGDRLYLAGSASDYTVEVFDGGVNILLNQTARNIIATLENLESFALNSSTSVFQTGGFVLPPIPPIIPISPFSTISSDAALPLETVSAAQAPASAQQSTPWVAQTNNVTVLENYLLEGVGGEIAGGTLTLEGDARAFGIFQGDPFDLGSGIVLSTGAVEDLDGKNEIDGGLYGPFAPEIEFENLGSFGGSGIFRGDLSFVGTVLNSITIADDNDAVGGGPLAFSGLELDAIALSRQLVTEEDIANGFDFNDPNQFERLDVFNFASAFGQFDPGSMRSLNGASPSDFQGTQNG